MLHSLGPQSSNAMPSSSPAELLAEGHKHFIQRRLLAAERCFARAVTLDPTVAQAHFRLGRVKMMRGDDESAITSLRTAVRLDESCTLARRYFAVLLVRAGRKDESMPLFRHESTSEEGRNWIRDLAAAAMRSRDLSLAGEYAGIAAELRWARPVLAVGEDSSLPDLPA